MLILTLWTIALISYLLFRFNHKIRRKIAKKRAMNDTFYMCKVILPPTQNDHETSQAIKQITNLFSFLSTTTHDRFSLEVHQEENKIFLIITAPNQFIIDNIKRGLFGMAGVRIEPQESDPINNYQNLPFACRLLVNNKYSNLQPEPHFFRELINFLTHARSQKAGVSFIFRPSHNFQHEAQTDLYNLEIQQEEEKETKKHGLSFTQELSTLFFGTEKKQTDDQKEIENKITSPVYSVDILTHSTDPHTAQALTSVFNTLGHGIFNPVFTFEDRHRQVALDRLLYRYVGEDHNLRTNDRTNDTGAYLNSQEIALLFHPDQTQNSNLESDPVKQLEPPTSLLTTGNLPIGETTTRTGKTATIKLQDNILHQHLIITGGTGGGKTVFANSLFLTMARECQNKALVFLDPHYLACESILQRTPDLENTIFLRPSQSRQGYTFTINPLFTLHDGETPEQRQTRKINKVEYLLDIFRGGESLGHTINNSLKLLIKSGVFFADCYYKYLYAIQGLDKDTATQQATQKQITFNDLKYAFNDNYQYKELFKIIFEHTAPELHEAWTQNFKAYSETTGIKGAIGRLEALANDITAPIFEGNKFNLFQETLTKKKIFLPIDSDSYPKEAKKMIIKLFLEGAWNEAQKINLHENETHNLHNTAFFVDEAEEIQSPVMSKILAQARKYKLNLVLITQYLDQFTTELKNSVINNPATFVSFAVGKKEANDTAPAFNSVTSQELQDCPRFHYYCKTIDQQTGKKAVFLSKSLNYDHPQNRFELCQEYDQIYKHNEACLVKYGDRKKDLLKQAQEKRSDPIIYFLS
jgi:hypothetical protein